MKSFVICCFFLGVAMATPVDLPIPLGKESMQMLREVRDNFDTLGERGQIQVINDFVDMAMTEVSSVMKEQNLDPMVLPDLYEKIKYKLILITYWGDLNLTKGHVEGVSTIHRNGDVVLDYTARVLSITVPLSFEKFVFDYRYKIKIMGLGPRGGCEGRAKNIRLKFVIDIDFLNLHLTLKKFDIEKVGAISVKFDGNILVDWLINLVTGVVTILFRDLIAWIIEIVVRQVLVNGIDQINDMLAGLPNPGAPSLGFDYSFMYQ